MHDKEELDRAGRRNASWISRASWEGGGWELTWRGRACRAWGAGLHWQQRKWVLVRNQVGAAWTHH